ncbi:unnamed protein product, partial [Vitis vinifera]|uniref:Uncharacterized protein n=1 Tax=Vitis vinifera TaxID=29760 RepID=E0CT70_VITVI
MDRVDPDSGACHVSSGGSLHQGIELKQRHQFPKSREEQNPSFGCKNGRQERCGRRSQSRDTSPQGRF